MQNLSSKIKLKVALRSFFPVIFYFILLIILLFSREIPLAKYIITGLITGTLLRIIFSRRKFLVELTVKEEAIVVHYLNSLLLKKIKSFSRGNLEVVYVDEANKWFGEPDRVNFSDNIQAFTFVNIDKNLKEEILNLNLSK